MEGSGVTDTFSSFPGCSLEKLPRRRSRVTDRRVDLEYKKKVREMRQVERTRRGPKGGGVDLRCRRNRARTAAVMADGGSDFVGSLGA